jgi:branched-chain amino acid transport system permease protein
MVSAMVSLSVIAALAGTALPPLVIVFAGVLSAVPVCMVVSFTMERIAYRPLRGAPRLAPLITAIGISIILQQVAMIIWSRNPLGFPADHKQSSIRVLGCNYQRGTDRRHSRLVPDNGGPNAAGISHASWCRHACNLRESLVARLMGINVNRVISAHLRDRCGLGAVAGVMVRTYYGIAHYTMGALLGMKAFSAAVLGGIGNLAGAMLGGVLLGVVEALGAGYIGEIMDLCHLSGISDALAARCARDNHFVLFGSNYQDVFAFMVLIAVLVFRPSGLLGERVSDRA